MTNSLTYDKQPELIKEVEGFGGSTPLPGSTEAPDRFARASYYVGRLPDPADAKEAMAAMLSVMRNVAQPFRIPDADKPSASTTIWQTVTDLTNGTYLFAPTLRPNMIWVRIGDLEFSEGTPVRKLDLVADVSLSDGLAGNVTDRFEESSPMQFLGVQA